MRALRTHKLRLRDRHAVELRRQARAVNAVWNYCNETQKKAAQDGRRWLSYGQLASLTAGAGKMLDIHSHTVQRVCRQYATSRAAHRRPWLRWRGRKSLGWVPFNTGHVSFDGDRLVFRGQHYQTMHLRDIPSDATIQAGSFNADSRGHWYVNITVEIEIASAMHNGPAVGVDLGLKDLAALSTGEKILAPRLVRASEERLATAQRAGKTKRARSIHRKVANRRKDFLHKVSHRLTKQFGTIVVGDVGAARMARSRMAKSVLDAGWASLKGMLAYKAMTRGGVLLEVCEANTTQTCSECGCLPASRPRGIAGLRIREWRCDDCGRVHDRDVNAARNILRIGQDALVEGAQHV